MATKQQIQANQANARRGTGPRTPEGKAKSSQNALKHGLRAQATVLPDENIDDFDLLVSELEDEFRPAGALEWTLLRQLADAEWRMRRVPLIEAAVLAKELHQVRRHYDDRPHCLPENSDEIEIFLIGATVAGDAVSGDVLAKLSRYESRLSHRYFKALTHLQSLQDRRAQTTASQPATPASPPTQPRKPPTLQTPTLLTPTLLTPTLLTPTLQTAAPKPPASQTNQCSHPRQPQALKTAKRTQFPSHPVPVSPEPLLGNRANV
jgi:hypothetical protein